MEKLHCLPRDLDSVPVYELEEIYAYYKLQDILAERAEQKRLIEAGAAFTKEHVEDTAAPSFGAKR